MQTEHCETVAVTHVPAFSKYGMRLSHVYFAMDLCSSKLGFSLRERPAARASPRGRPDMAGMECHMHGTHILAVAAVTMDD